MFKLRRRTDPNMIGNFELYFKTKENAMKYAEQYEGGIYVDWVEDWNQGIYCLIPDVGASYFIDKIETED